MLNTARKPGPATYRCTPDTATVVVIGGNRDAGDLTRGRRCRHIEHELDGRRVRNVKPVQAAVGHSKAVAVRDLDFTDVVVGLDDGDGAGEPGRSDGRDVEFLMRQDVEPGTDDSHLRHVV